MNWLTDVKLVGLGVALGMAMMLAFCQPKGLPTPPQVIANDSVVARLDTEVAVAKGEIKALLVTQARSRDSASRVTQLAERRVQQWQAVADSVRAARVPNIAVDTLPVVVSLMTENTALRHAGAAKDTLIADLRTAIVDQIHAAADLNAKWINAEGRRDKEVAALKDSEERLKAQLAQTRRRGHWSFPCLAGPITTTGSSVQLGASLGVCYHP